MVGAAYPNPAFNTATIPFVIKEPTSVRISIYDLTGRKVKDVADSMYQPGVYAAEWDRTDHNGVAVSPGMYIYRMHLAGVAVLGVHKLVLK
jgi:flagellar hook assembly protein FlgD